jgi:hypothetical protein
MGNSHKNLLFRNHWTTCNQTYVEWSLEDPLPKLCPVIPTSNQDGHQAKNRKKGMKFKRNLLLWNYWANLNKTLLKWSLGGPLPKLCLPFQNSDLLPRWLPQPNLIYHRPLCEIPIKIFLSETICSIRTKFWRNSHWMVLFQKCVRWFGPPTKMAHTAELSLT